MWNTVDQKLDEEQWLMPAQTINAYYNANNNEVCVIQCIIFESAFTNTISRLWFLQVYCNLHSTVLSHQNT